MSFIIPHMTDDTYITLCIPFTRHDIKMILKQIRAIMGDGVVHTMLNEGLDPSFINSFIRI